MRSFEANLGITDPGYVNVLDIDILSVLLFLKHGYSIYIGHILKALIVYIFFFPLIIKLI